VEYSVYYVASERQVDGSDIHTWLCVKREHYRWTALGLEKEDMMFAAGKRSGFAPALDYLQANVVWLYSGARKKKDYEQR
jgi:hypothetical protein